MISHPVRRPAPCCVIPATAGIQCARLRQRRRTARAQRWIPAGDDGTGDGTESRDPKTIGMTLPSLNLLLQSILSGIFIGGLYGLIGLGLGLKNSGLGMGVPDTGRCLISVEQGVVHVRTSAAGMGQGVSQMALHMLEQEGFLARTLDGRFVSGSVMTRDGATP